MTSRLTRLAIAVVLVVTAGACAVMWPRRKGDNVSTRARVTTALASTTSPASAPSGAQVAVSIQDLRNQKGVLVFGIFRQAAGFPDAEKKSFYWEVRDADSPDLTFTTRLPPGRYAASVLHDENRSGEMDRGFGGLPLEGYGVTNNPKPKMRAATFKEATFTVPDGRKALTISVQYQFL